MMRFIISANMHDGKCRVESNVKRELWATTIFEIVRSQMAGGKTKSAVPKDVDVFEIKAYIDLSSDRVSVSSNCGSSELELGILNAVASNIGNIGSVCYI
jgi:hypothetical protein